LEEDQFAVDEHVFVFLQQDRDAVIQDCQFPHLQQILLLVRTHHCRIEEVTDFEVDLDEKVLGEV
jgi:hypothetical protein